MGRACQQLWIGWNDTLKYFHGCWEETRYFQVRNEGWFVTAIAVAGVLVSSCNDSDSQFCQESQTVHARAVSCVKTSSEFRKPVAFVVSSEHACMLRQRKWQPLSSVTACPADNLEHMAASISVHKTGIHPRDPWTNCFPTRQAWNRVYWGQRRAWGVDGELISTWKNYRVLVKLHL